MSSTKAEEVCEDDQIAPNAQRRSKNALLALQDYSGVGNGVVVAIWAGCTLLLNAL